MSKKHFYKTGDVASFNSVSSDTVRLYDKEELVTPSFTDNNGYRYYKFDEVLKFNTATAFREVGFSIENIKKLFEEKNIDHILTSTEDQLKNLEIEKSNLERKMNYLNLVKKVADDFYHNKTMIEYLENVSFYMFAYTQKKGNKKFSEHMKLRVDCIEDTFWARTSTVGYEWTLDCNNTLEFNSFCFNLAAGNSNEITEKILKKCLRYKYKSNKVNTTDIKSIFLDVIKYSKEKNLQVNNTFYQTFYFFADHIAHPYCSYIFFEVL